MFLFLAACMVIDATDGTLARAWKVTTWAPSFDGRRLDDIIDYMTYAFIPLFFAYRYGLVNGSAGLMTLFVAVMAAVYGFCQNSAKTADGFFTGFPNYWNIVIFYLYLLKTPPQANILILLFFAVMIFVPFGYASFSTAYMRKAVLALSGAYGIYLLYMLAAWERLNSTVVLVSLLFPMAYTIISLYSHFSRRTKTAKGI